MIGTTAQGITFARFCQDIWSFLVPIAPAAGFSNVAPILVAFLSISGVVGFPFMPSTAGPSLEKKIEAERAGDPFPEKAPA